MIGNYLKMIKDLFRVWDLIELHVSQNQSHYNSWDINLISLELYGNQETKTLNITQAAQTLNCSKSEVEHFFVIYCFLSNRLHSIVGERNYSSWSVKNQTLQVVFKNNIIEYFDIRAINDAIGEDPEKIWHFDALEKTLAHA